MAKTFALYLNSKTEEGMQYAREYLKSHTPEGFDYFDCDDGDAGISIYASNLFDPEFHILLTEICEDLREKDLPHRIMATACRYVCDISQQGAFVVGHYEPDFSNDDEDGCPPLKLVEYEVVDLIYA